MPELDLEDEVDGNMDGKDDISMESSGDQILDFREDDMDCILLLNLNFCYFFILLFHFLFLLLFYSFFCVLVLTFF